MDLADVWVKNHARKLLPPFNDREVRRSDLPVLRAGCAHHPHWTVCLRLFSVDNCTDRGYAARFRRFIITQTAASPATAMKMIMPHSVMVGTGRKDSALEPSSLKQRSV